MDDLLAGPFEWRCTCGIAVQGFATYSDAQAAGYAHQRATPGHGGYGHKMGVRVTIPPEVAPMTLSRDTPLFVVHGPTPEWGDGIGPLAFFLSRDVAESFIRFEQDEVHDQDLEDSWPYDTHEYDIEETLLGSVDIPDEVLDKGEQAVTDYLNGA